MVIEKASFATNPLEQFVLLAKTAKGAACLELIKQVLEAPGVYVFGELLDMPNVSEVTTVQSNFCKSLLKRFFLAGKWTTWSLLEYFEPVCVWHLQRVPV